MRRVILLSSFFFLTPVVLILSLLFLSFISSQKASSLGLIGKSPKIAYAAIPASSSTMIFKANAEDTRVGAVREFLSNYKSVLTPYAQAIVSTADKYDLDYRLLPAIAMQESTLCKKTPKNSFNCWGFGIYGSKITRFSNYNEAIETVSKTLATKYKAAGLETPEQIMSKYTPSSPNGSWAIGVASTMEKLSISL